MSKTSKQTLGMKGEELACQYLQEKGCQIVVRNYRSGRSELDIVALQNRAVLICEVKSYYADPLGAAEFRVNKHKQKQIIQGTYAFLADHGEFEDMDIRFDVIIVDFSHYPAQITHHEGAFWQESF